MYSNYLHSVNNYSKWQDCTSGCRQNPNMCQIIMSNLPSILIQELSVSNLFRCQSHMLVTNFNHICQSQILVSHTHLITEGQVTFPSNYQTYLIMVGQLIFPIHVPHPPDYGRICYIYPPATTTTWLHKDKLHLHYIYHNHLITEEQVTFTLHLPQPPDYGRTSYIYPPATTPT